MRIFLSSLSNLLFSAVSPQTLMNQESQQQIIAILDNTENFLLTHGANMSQAELDTVKTFTNLDAVKPSGFRSPTSSLASSVLSTKPQWTVFSILSSLI